MEWIVVTTVASIIALGMTVMTPILKLNSSITRLTTLIDESEKKLSNFSASNEKSHELINKKIDKQDERIRNVEQKVGKVYDEYK